MITGAILLFFIGVIEFFSDLLPLADPMNNAFETAWTFAAGFIANLLWTIPNGQGFLLPSATFIAIMIPMMIWFLINWVTRNR